MKDKKLDAHEVCSWIDLDEDGRQLQVYDFLTTQFAQTSNLLRRTITVPYANEHGLSVSEWRILSLLAHQRSLPFTDLVEVSASDKALVSRTMGLLAKRGLALSEVIDPARPKRLVCRLTPEGRALYTKVIPEARRSQARVLLKLTVAERRVLYQVLKKLRGVC